jgi:nitric oxide reductase activation protein
MHLLDLMEPEETVGNLWHDMASRIGAQVSYPQESVTLASVRPSLAVLFRALGGAPGVEMIEVPTTPVRHRQPVRRKLGAERDHEWVARFDGEQLSLPPFVAVFPDASLNRAAYFWLTALAGVSDLGRYDFAEDGAALDCVQIRANMDAADAAYALCRGLREKYERMAHLCVQARPNVMRPPQDVAMENAILDQLCGAKAPLPAPAPAQRYMTAAPVPIWLRFANPGSGDAAGDDRADPTAPPPNAAHTTRKPGQRKDQDQQNRKDSFIIRRFESILSWVESMNINRSVDDDDDENAQKAADDQDDITLSKQDRKAATRLRLHLDLSPADADHEALAGGIDAAGDRLGIRGFSSLRRDRVFLKRCKEFDVPMSAEITANIGALSPGHYTRLGAAIRHVSAQLAQQPSARKLLIVLTDGKPNDLDHYEGQHGIEDSHMAVREARNAGQSLHGIIIDEDGQDWFARIFGRGGFTLLPDPERLTRALPDIYRTLTQET